MLAILSVIDLNAFSSSYSAVHLRSTVMVLKDLIRENGVCPFRCVGMFSTEALTLGYCVAISERVFFRWFMLNSVFQVSQRWNTQTSASNSVVRNRKKIKKITNRLI